MRHEDHHLRQMLTEDADTGDIDALFTALQHLIRDDLVTTNTSEALITRLASELPQRSWRESWAWLLLWSQRRVIQSEIWIASILVIALGTLITLANFDATSTGLTPLAIAAPVIAAIGVGLLYDSESAQIRDLENSTRASVQMLLLARLTLVFGFNLIAALAGSMLLALSATHISLMPLVMSWLAPMTFLSALAFFISVVAINAVIGGAISLGLWMLHVFMQSTDANALIVQVLSLHGLAAPESRPLLFLGAVMLVGVALWLSSFDENTQGLME